MSYDYEEELARAREIRRKQRLEKQKEQQGTGGVTEGDRSRDGAENRARDAGTRVSRGREINGQRSNRSSGKQEKNGKNRETGRRRKRIITMIVAEIFTLFLIFGYAYAYKIYSKPQRLVFEKDNIKSEALSVDDIKKMKGYWMIAVFGVDSRGTNVGAGTNADVNMICCINQDTGDIKLISVFRDSYMSIDDKGSYNKINQAYAIGGPEQAVRALNKNLDLNITDYITFNWKGVADAINILGGVDLLISPAEFKYINSFITETVKSTGVGSHQLKKSGMNHLDGVQAVAYGRLRLMDTDFARTERQRKIIQLAFEKARQAEYSVLNNILVVVLPQVATSLDFADLTSVALNITKYQLGDTYGFPMARGESNMGRKGACVVPATLESNVKLLHQYLFEDEVYDPSETVKKISAKIASDTGIYKEGQVIGHVSTEGVLPKETKAPETAEATTEEETTTEAETSTGGQPVTGSTEETSKVYPGIGETDESGNLVDGPEDVDPTVGPGTTTAPEESSSTRPPFPGTEPTKPGSTMPSESNTGPGVRPGETTPLPGPGETTQAVKPGPSPSESTAPVAPGGESTTSPGPGDVIGDQGPGGA